MTGRRPFERSSEPQVVEAILREIPPPASEFNPAVNQALSQAIHKAMVKQPWNRFSSAKEFGEILQKALHSEPIEIFNPARIRPRLQRVAEALEKATTSLQILDEPGAERPFGFGHLGPAPKGRRGSSPKDGSAVAGERPRMEEEDYPLAPQKLQEVLGPGLEP